MGKTVKKLVLITLALVMSLFGCDNSNQKPATSREEPRPNSWEVLHVYNASDYMDMSTIRDFENEYQIRVEYSEFDTNEDMYDEIAANPGTYDVLIPSDYTIDRLIQEDRLAKLDMSKITNASYISPQYLKPSYDQNNDYCLPYMVGTLGILYNTRYVSGGSIDSWTALWEPQYKGKILMWDSMRDAIGPTLKMLGYSMNSNSDTELAEAKARLMEQRSLASYGEDEIRDMMIADEGALAVMYSGDAKTAVDQNPKLAYVIPKEGGNKWVDGFVILKDTRHMEAAQNFINFMCRPNIAVRNMTRTGYTSPVFGAWGEFGGNPIMFPSEEELGRCEAFLYNRDAAQKYDRLWSELR